MPTCRATTARVAMIATAGLMLAGIAAPSAVGAQDTTDSRTAVVLPPSSRNAVLAEMRMMLGSV